MYVENTATDQKREPELRMLSGTNQPLICPRCVSFTMHERHVGGVAIDVCQLCGGVWLDRGELEALIGSRRPA